MWGVVLFFRLPGFLLAKIAISFGVSATSITVFGFVATFLTAVASVVLPASTAIPAIALLATCFQILDCADGTIARATGTVSHAGRFLDFSSDLLSRAVCLAAIGHVVDGFAPGVAPSCLAVGLCAGFCATYARLMRCYVGTLSAGTDPAPGVSGGRSILHMPMAMIYGFLSGLDQLFPLLALLAWPYGHLKLLLMCGLVYHAVDAALAGVAGVLALRAADRQSYRAGGR